MIVSFRKLVCTCSGIKVALCKILVTIASVEKTPYIPVVFCQMKICLW